MKKIDGIILLAGNSTRYGSNINKNFLKINNKYVFSYSLLTFNENKYIDSIILVVRKEDLLLVREIISELKNDLKKDIKIVIGGKTRGKSVYNALLESNSDVVVIHDAARPLIKDEYINKCLEYMPSYKGVVVGVKVKDTIKITNDDNEVINSTYRINTWAIQTPQVFDKDLLLSLYQKYKNKEFTDDASLLEAGGYKVKIVESDYTNIKITTKEDLIFVKEYVKTYKTKQK